MELWIWAYSTLIAGISTRIDYAVVLSENVFNNVQRFSIMIGID